MKTKYVAFSLIIIALLLGIFIYLTKQREDFYVNKIIEEQQGICYVDGFCLHEREYTSYYFGGFLVAMLFILSMYLLFFDRSHKVFLKQQEEATLALRKAKERDEFQAYLAGFSEEEQKVLKAVHEQEGIQQSTLRYRINMPKTSLSLVLKSLEERGIIAKKEHGKTNQIFLVRKF